MHFWLGRWSASAPTALLHYVCPCLRTGSVTVVLLGCRGHPPRCFGSAAWLTAVWGQSWPGFRGLVILAPLCVPCAHLPLQLFGVAPSQPAPPSGCVCGLVEGRFGVLRRPNFVVCLVMAKPLRVTPAFDWAVRGSLDGTLRPLGDRRCTMQWLRTTSWMASSWLPHGVASRLRHSLTALCRSGLALRSRPLGVMVRSDG